jgi:hypothetical protein
VQELAVVVAAASGMDTINHFYNQFAT